MLCICSRPNPYLDHTRMVRIKSVYSYGHTMVNITETVYKCPFWRLWQSVTISILSSSDISDNVCGHLQLGRNCFHWLCQNMFDFTVTDKYPLDTYYIGTILYVRSSVLSEPVSLRVAKATSCNAIRSRYRQDLI